MIGESPFLRSLDSSLADLIPNEAVELTGTWSTTTRKTYATHQPTVAGAGPYDDVEDHRWQGTMLCQSPATAIAFLVTETEIHWAKAPAVALTLPVEVSLHAHAGPRGDRATFTARVAGAYLPGVAVASPDELEEVRSIGPTTFTTGRVVTLAHTDGVTVAAVVIPGLVIKVGRKHLWRLRSEIASPLAADIRELLTRRRSGVIASTHPSPTSPGTPRR